MGRLYHVNGPTLVTTDGDELGLSDSPINMMFNFAHDNVMVNAWGNRIPPALQFMLASVDINMTLVHYDSTVLQAKWSKSFGGNLGAGLMTGAGTLLKTPSDFITLRFTSPIDGLPWRFITAYIVGNPSYPLGTEKSLVNVSWKALPIPPAGDPYNGGAGAASVILYDHT